MSKPRLFNILPIEALYGPLMSGSPYNSPDLDLEVFLGCLSVPRCQDAVVVILVISPPFKEIISLQSECEVEVKIDQGILYNDKSLNL